MSNIKECLGTDKNDLVEKEKWMMEERRDNLGVKLLRK